MCDAVEKRKKGGAEKVREKKKKLLMDNAKISGDIRVMFSKSKVCIYLFIYFLYFFNFSFLC